MACPFTTKGSLLNSLLLMLKKGTLNYLNGYYFLKNAPLTDEAARRIQTTRAPGSRGWSKYQPPATPISLAMPSGSL